MVEVRRSEYLLSCWLLVPFSIQAAHPLDPLTKDEILMARETLRAAGKLHATTRFVSIDLEEPPKAEVLAFRGGPFPRRAFVLLYERAADATWEATVDLRARKIDSWKQIRGVEPPLLDEDFSLLEKIVRADPRWRAALGRRGIADLENVRLDPWPTGNFGWPEENGKRIVRAGAFYAPKGANPYAHPVEGVVATVDVNAGKVIKLTDTGEEPSALSGPEFGETPAGLPRSQRAPQKTMPLRNVNFTVNGNEVRWRKWRFRYGFHPREGLVLYTVGYEDQGHVRSILYRGSLSEVVTAYAEPGGAWYFRNRFDEGEYGLGRLAVPLEPVGDAPENARFFDVYRNGESGLPLAVKHAVAIYERDGGLLWKRHDPRTGAAESRRGRELVLSWMAAAGNSDYGFNWIFHEDGRIEMAVEVTGVPLVKGAGGEKEIGGRPHGRGAPAEKIAPGLLGVNHQHFFNFRLDLDVDSAGGNRVLEVNSHAVPPGPLNTQKNAFVTREDTLDTEGDAGRNTSTAESRHWKVINPGVKNALGEPVGYVLKPGENTIPYADPQSSLRKRAGFLSSQFWATPYDPAERYAAGDYVNQSAGGEGLARWTRANRSIRDADVVVWYTVGMTHIPRPEDWPVMPVSRAGFELIPAGFFSKNLAGDGY